MVNVAVLGCGTVGSGVADVFRMNSSLIAKQAGREIRVKYILDIRDLSGTPYEELQIRDFALIESDPEISVVVESIGGAGIAYEFTKRALAAGKSVVTSNKELVATHGDELLRLARENNVSYLFEASVGGGIPLIHPISRCLTANDLTEVCGILNGTTNYILTKMIREGISFKLALKQACDNGYAELDPTDDIEGKDACRKICILASLLSGRHIRPEQSFVQGITGVSLSDVKFAESANYKIKLLGRALRTDEGRWAVWVSPHLVPASNPLSCVEDVFNAILVSGNAVDDVMFYGRGAGKMATASAVVSDVIDIVASAPRVLNDFWDGDGPDITCDSAAIPSKWYIRTNDQSLAAALSGQTVLRNTSAKTSEAAFITKKAYNRQALDTLIGRTVPLSLMRVL